MITGINLFLLGKPKKANTSIHRWEPKMVVTRALALVGAPVYRGDKKGKVIGFSTASPEISKVINRECKQYKCNRVLVIRDARIGVVKAGAVGEIPDKESWNKALQTIFPEHRIVEGLHSFEGNRELLQDAFENHKKTLELLQFNAISDAARVAIQKKFTEFDVQNYMDKLKKWGITTPSFDAHDLIASIGNDMKSWYDLFHPLLIAPSQVSG